MRMMIAALSPKHIRPWWNSCARKTQFPPDTDECLPFCSSGRMCTQSCGFRSRIHQTNTYTQKDAIICDSLIITPYSKEVHITTRIIHYSLFKIDRDNYYIFMLKFFIFYILMYLYFYVSLYFLRLTIGTVEIRNVSCMSALPKLTFAISFGEGEPSF